MCMTEDQAAGCLLRIAREVSGLKQKEAAEMLGINGNCLWTYEDGKTPMRFTFVNKALKLYGLDQSYFIEAVSRLSGGES